MLVVRSSYDYKFRQWTGEIQITAYVLCQNHLPGIHDKDSTPKTSTLKL